MFRRSLQVFAAAVMIGLLLTVGYAALRFRGPAEAIDDAEAMFRRGELRSAIALLELCAKSPTLQHDQQLRHRLWRVRYAAYSQLADNAGALRDVENLLRESDTTDEGLWLDRIRLLALVGDGERALQLARTFLLAHPGNGRALELAGEAGQSTYRDELRTMVSGIERDVGSQHEARAREGLLAFLYRPDGDVEVAQGLATLRAIYATESRLMAAWPGQQQALHVLRSRVQESLDFFRRSLEAGGEPVAAFQGLALSLDQSQRTSDLLVLCESYRQRYDHQYVVDAGAIAAWAQVRAGQNAAAIATAERWLPAGAWLRRQAEGKLGSGVGDLLMARITAAWRLGQRRLLEKVAAETQAMTKAGIKIPLPHHLVNALIQYLGKDVRSAEANLRVATDLLLRTPVPLGQQDLLPELLPLRLGLMRARNADDAEMLAVFAAWKQARPTAVEARLQLAEFQLERGKASAAMATLDDAGTFAPGDERILGQRLATARVLYRDSNQAGEGLLAQCLQRGTLVPEVPDPLGFLLCAETALTLKVPLVARESARAAVDKFPWARRPRLLEAEAELLAERHADAARVLDKLLLLGSPDAATLTLALRAHRLAGLPPGELLAMALRTCEPGPELHAELLRSALAAEPEAAEPFAAAALRRQKPSVELRILAAQVMARSNRLAEATVLLESLQPGLAGLTATERAELATAVTALLLAAAANVPDGALEPQALRNAARFALVDAAAAPALMACARELADQHPATAYSLLTTALAAADAEARNGADFALAGDLAARLGQRHLAEEHWTAALGFPDGRHAAEPLARLCFATGRPDRAQQVYRLVETPEDAAMALRCGQRSRHSRGERLLREALGRDGADLLAHAALATIGLPALGDLPAAEEARGHANLELLSLLTDPQLAAEALALAQVVAAANPGSSTAQLLLARAQLQVGQTAAARAVHTAVFARGQVDALFWRELALAARSPGYALDDAQLVALGIAAAQDKVAGSPVVVAFTLQRTAEIAAKSGNRAVAEQMQTSMWLQFPQVTKPTAKDAEAVAARGQALNAWWILERIRPTLHGPERRRCVQRMYELAAGLAAAKAAETELLYQTALQLLAVEGPLGCLVHFLIDHGDRFPRLRPEPAVERRLLSGQIRLAAAGRDSADWLQRSTDRLAGNHGLDVALAEVEAALASHPTCVPLWRLRAGLLTHVQRGQQGIDDLRAVLAHCVAPAEQLAFVTLAAAEFALAPDDARLLDTLPKELLTSPAGTLARGLVALREGRADDAVSLLARADKRPDGLHLAAYGEALLQSKEPDAVRRAAAVFAALATDYPSSSLARNAGSFARQLAPR